ncbi:MAG: hypothetical protein ACI82A_000381 [Candidatus Azotimanducaceae bacterium]|jgi:hypothetical protein
MNLQRKLQLKQIGLAMTLTCLANSAFPAEIAVFGALTSVQTVSKPAPAYAPGKLSLLLQPRLEVSVPAPFDVSAKSFALCVETERDTPDLFLASVELGLNKTLVNAEGCLTADNVDLDLNTIQNQSGKIVTLLLAPE